MTKVLANRASVIMKNASTILLSFHFSAINQKSKECRVLKPLANHSKQLYSESLQSNWLSLFRNQNKKEADKKKSSPVGYKICIYKQNTKHLNK